MSCAVLRESDYTGARGRTVRMISTTAEVREQHRFDPATLERYMREHVAGFTGSLTVRQFRGGQSNPTYYITAGGEGGGGRGGEQRGRHPSPPPGGAGGRGRSAARMNRPHRARTGGELPGRFPRAD